MKHRVFIQIIFEAKSLDKFREDNKNKTDEEKNEILNEYLSNAQKLYFRDVSHELLHVKVNRFFGFESSEFYLYVIDLDREGIFDNAQTSIYYRDSFLSKLKYVICDFINTMIDFIDQVLGFQVLKAFKYLFFEFLKIKDIFRIVFHKQYTQKEIKETYKEDTENALNDLMNKEKIKELNSYYAKIMSFKSEKIGVINHWKVKS